MIKYIFNCHNFVLKAITNRNKRVVGVERIRFECTVAKCSMVTNHVGKPTPSICRN